MKTNKNTQKNSINATTTPNAAMHYEEPARVELNPNVSAEALMPANTPGNHAIRTWNWKLYGNNTPNGLAALKEAVNNGIQYAILGRDVLHTAGPARVDVNTKHQDEDVYLEVLNSGAPADLLKMMHYGDSAQQSQLSQYGTGDKTFFSYFSPDGQCGIVYTKVNGRKTYIQLPYGDNMSIHECSDEEWPFEDWVVTGLRVKVDDVKRLETITADALGMHYAPLLRTGVNLFFNGVQVFAINPIGEKTPGYKSINIDEETIAHVDMMHYYLSEDTAHYMFPVGLEPHGSYIYVNGVFATHEGVKLFFKTPKCTKTKMADHPYFNRLITVFNITTPANHKADVMFNSNKTEIKWNEGYGPQYLAAINELAAQLYRDEYRRHAEVAQGNLYDAVIASVMKRRSGGIIRQFPCNKMKRKDPGGLFADTAVCNGTLPNGKPDPSTVDTIYEYKAETFTSKHVGVVWNYWRAIKHHYGVKVAIVFIGEDFDPEALLAIQDLKEMGIDCDIISSNKDKLFHH